VVAKVSIARLAIRLGRFLVFRVGLPVFTGLVLLGLMSGGHGRIGVSPSPLSVAQSLHARHVLPRGTTFALGNPADPLLIDYDQQGRIVVTPPRNLDFGQLLTSGLDEAAKMLDGKDLQVAGATLATSTPSVH
jgi:hypothetical protein